MAVSGAAPGSASAPTVAVPRSPRSYRGSAEPPPTRTTVPRYTGGHPPPHLAATSRARPNAHHAEHHRPDPPCPEAPPAAPNRTSRRRAAPTPTGTTRSPTRRRHLRGSHAHRRRTRDRAPRGCRTNSSPAPPSPDERCASNQMAVSGAAPGSALSLVLAKHQVHHSKAPDVRTGAAAVTEQLLVLAPDVLERVGQDRHRGELPRHIHLTGQRQSRARSPSLGETHRHLLKEDFDRTYVVDFWVSRYVGAAR